MDREVLNALAKWPGVPDVYGWLALTRRGEWRLRGEPVRHAGLAAFINRNYAADARGAWYFQNGPQRVYARLEYTPLIYRLGAGAPRRPVLESHAGTDASEVSAAWLDEQGSLLLATALGVGVVSDRDLPALAELLGGSEEAPQLTWRGARIAVGRIDSAAVPARFGFVQDPAPPRPA